MAVENEAVNYKLLFVLLFLSALPLGAQEFSWPKEWRWGVAAWEDHGVSGNYQYLLRNMPLRILRFVSPSVDHQVSRDEAFAYAAQQRRLKLEELAVKVSGLRTKLDEMFFDVTKGTGDRKTLSEEWLDAKKEWNNSEALPPSISTPPSQIPLKFLSKSEDEDLLPPLVGPPEKYETELEYLAAGSLEEVEGLLYFTFRLYSFVENRDLFLIRKAYLPEEADQFFVEAAAALAEHLLGREWGSISVESEIPASLYLNGDLVGEQAAHIPFLLPGYYTLESVAPGYLTTVKGILLLPNEEKKVLLTMEKGEWLDLSVLTTPPGADIFLGSRWIGATPWEGEVPPEYNRVTIRKDGYHEAIRFLTPRGGADWEITLQDEAFDRQKELKARRDWFYFSLGAFLISIPVTMTLYSVYDIAHNARTAEIAAYGSSGETEKLSLIENIGNFGFWGALFIDAGLFVNMIFSAVDYVKVAGTDFRE